MSTLADWGLGLIDVSPRIGAAFGVERGAYIMFVEKDGPADEAGVARNSVVIAVDGVEVTDVSAVAEALTAAGSEGGFTVLEVIRSDGSSAFFEMQVPVP